MFYKNSKPQNFIRKTLTQICWGLDMTHYYPAIKLESTYKTYGSGKSKTQVLIGLNMEVPKGQIYGLLGKFS